MLLIKVAVFCAGAYIVLSVILSAIRTFVLPRSANDGLTRKVFRFSSMLFSLRTRRAKTYEELDKMRAMFAPITLVSLPMVWIVLLIFAYTLMYWGLGVEPFERAFRLSGSSLLTLGFEFVPDLLPTILSFTQASMGPILMALLISYLPTMYAAFSRRETAVTMLEVRAGTPPFLSDMLVRYHLIRGLGELDEIWETWEVWFSEVAESHTSLAALTFFRSPQPDRHWVTAAGAVLDAASFVTSTVDMPPNPRAQLCIRAGFICLRQIADFFRIPYDHDPKPDDPISITREEYDAVCDQLVEAGIPLRPDRDQTWRDFAGWRVNYDPVLLELAQITFAPYAPWSSDRGRVDAMFVRNGQVRRPRKKRSA